MILQIVLLSFASLLMTIQVLSLALSTATVFRPEFESIVTDYQPSVTVIVPTYNEEPVIERCIKSLLNQEYRNDKLQILVIDDKSSDRTREIVKEYTSLGVKLLTREVRSTKTSAINYAGKFAEGEVVAIFDADACLEPDCIKNAVRNFTDERIGGIVGFQKPINIKQNWLTRVLSIGDFLRFFMEVVWSRYEVNNLLMGECMFIRRSLLDETSWLDDNMILDDGYLSMKILFASYRIKLDRAAIVWCEQPYDYRVFLKQRRRWFRGAFQLIGAIKDNRLSRGGTRRLTFWGRTLHIYPYYIPLFMILLLLLSIVGYALLCNPLLFLISLAGIIASLLLVFESSTYYKEWRREYIYVPLWILISTLAIIVIVPLGYLDELLHRPVVFYKRPKSGAAMFRSEKAPEH